MTLLDLERWSSIVEIKLEKVDAAFGRIWRCVDCGYAYRQKGNVRDHIEAIHILERISCHLCSEQFNTTTSLRKHWKQKHF